MGSKKDYTLYTIGYESQDISTFVNKLKKQGINCIIDVREQPLSRKPGFSKNKLAQILKDKNITYIHLRELGSPKEIRDKFKEDHDWDFFSEKIREYLDSQKEVIETAYSYLLNNVCCLMCFERLPVDCHRKIVAEKIKERDGNGLLINHI